MNAALESALKRLLSVADYHRMGEAGIFSPDERVELIEGEIIAVPPPIGPTHNGLVNRLNRLLVRAVGDHAIVQVQGPVRLSDLSEPEPDLALLRPRDDFYEEFIPMPADTLLVIEVADSTLAYDRDVKVPQYARHGVPEAWLLNVRERELVVYRVPDGRRYAEKRVQQLPVTLDVAALPGVSVDLAGILGTG